MRNDFLPVILGSDWNVYGVAFSFYEAYKIKSISLCIYRQRPTDKLDFLDVFPIKDFDHREVFLKTLKDFKKKHMDKKLLLISCSDYYTNLIVSVRDEIKDLYIFNYVDRDLHDKLENKVDAYRIFEKYGMDFPKTKIVSKDSYKDLDIPFSFPVVCKANDSTKWLNLKFPGKKKAYIVDSLEELRNILDIAYTNAYDDLMIIQDYIPGGPEEMYVVNAYVTKNGKVTMTHGARACLESVLPYEIGNYDALLSGDYRDLTGLVKDFLEKIGYRGYANFDFKYDKRDKKFKLFEINLRQGKSSMYMTYAGNNFVEYLTKDMIDDEEVEYYDHRDEHLWYMVSKYILKKYSPDILKGDINRLLKEGKASFGYDYYSNKNIFRALLSLRRKLSTIKNYPKYWS